MSSYRLIPLAIILGSTIAVTTANASSAALDDEDAAFAALLGAPEDQRGSMAEAFLEEHEAASDARRATAHSILGDVQWRASCPIVDGGLCVEQQAPTRSGNCAERRRPIQEPIARDPAAAAEALEHLAEAVALAGSEEPADAAHARRFRDAMGRARVQLADAKLEAYLGLRAPATIDLEGEAGAEEFSQLVQTLTTQGGALIRTYAAVKSTRSADWVLVAAARTGMVAETPVELLNSLVFPEDSTDTQVMTYCSSVETVTAPMLQTARDAYQWCIVKAEKYEMTHVAAVQTCKERWDAITDGEDR